MTTPDDAPAALPAIPDVTLHAEIARGGMGVVYRGRQDFLDRDVAVKLLSTQLQGEQFAARFRREAKILAGIKHPNIVGCYLAGTTGTGQSYLVMEFVDGPNLRSWIAEHGPLAVPAALRLARQLASALCHAADQGVIHRDVKPENVLLEAPTSTSLDLSFPWVPKLVDLGLARMTHETGDLALTMPGALMGTPATMAPEQFDDPEAVDFRADIYGLGCVLYQMLTGVLPFTSTQLTDIVVAKRRQQAPDPGERRPDLPVAVGRLVMAMLASDRERRPATYHDLIARLEDALAAASRAPAPAKPAGQRPGAAGGKQVGLLQTAELAFLVDDGGNGPRPAAAAAPIDFPEPSGVLPRPPAPAKPRGYGPVVGTRGPARRSRARLALGVVASVALLVLAVAVVARPHGPGAMPAEPRASAPTETAPPDAAPSETMQPAAAPAETAQPTGATAEPAAPEPPAVAIGGLDGEIRPGVPIALQAQVRGGETAALGYLWTVQPEHAARLAAPKAASTSLVLEGLPGDTFQIALEVGDGHAAPARVAHEFVLDYAPVDLFADLLASDSPWNTLGRLRGGWTRREDDGAAVCAAAQVPGIRVRPIPGRTWRIAGLLRPEREGRRFAQTSVALRIGAARSLAVSCERAGTDGERWSVSLQVVDREDRRGGFSFRAQRDLPEPVQVVDEHGAVLGARYTITRRGDQIVFEFGFAGAGESREHHERLQAAAENAMLMLCAKGGRGVFPKLELW
ncbi:MAG TPA: serine/threonine-protein kinase [Planctomycetota bacterium]|nr:serine/threonine-protein kinase [Planctomycetota bacterium]